MEKKPVVSVKRKRRCKFCGKDLPRNSAPNREYCVGCRQKKYYRRIAAEARRGRKFAA